MLVDVALQTLMYGVAQHGLPPYVYHARAIGGLRRDVYSTADSFVDHYRFKPEFIQRFRNEVAASVGAIRYALRGGATMEDALGPDWRFDDGRSGVSRSDAVRMYELGISLVSVPDSDSKEQSRTIFEMLQVAGNSSLFQAMTLASLKRAADRSMTLLRELQSSFAEFKLTDFTAAKLVKQDLDSNSRNVKGNVPLPARTMDILKKIGKGASLMGLMPEELAAIRAAYEIASDFTALTNRTDFDTQFQKELAIRWMLGGETSHLASLDKRADMAVKKAEGFYFRY